MDVWLWLHYSGFQVSCHNILYELYIGVWLAHCSHGLTRHHIIKEFQNTHIMKIPEDTENRMLRRKKLTDNMVIG
jgi:hypothetical protein